MWPSCSEARSRMPGAQDGNVGARVYDPQPRDGLIDGIAFDSYSN